MRIGRDLPLANYPHHGKGLTLGTAFVSEAVAGSRLPGAYGISGVLCCCFPRARRSVDLAAMPGRAPLGAALQGGAQRSSEGLSVSRVTVVDQP